MLSRQNGSSVDQKEPYALLLNYGTDSKDTQLLSRSISIFRNDSPECLEVHELGVAVEGAGGGEDDEGEEAVVDVAVRAEVLARVRAPDLQAVVGALWDGQRRGQLARLLCPLFFFCPGESLQD